MTANFETINKTAVTLTAQQNYKKMKYYQQYKATESVLYYHRAGLSYNVASIGFVKPKPTAETPKGAKPL